MTGLGQRKAVLQQMESLGTDRVRLEFRMPKLCIRDRHDAAQLSRGLGGIDPAPEAVAHQQRQLACMVDMLSLIHIFLMQRTYRRCQRRR